MALKPTIIVLLASICCLLGSISQVAAQEQQKCPECGFLQVSGTGKIPVAATMAKIRLGVEHKGQQAVEVLSKVGEDASRLYSMLRSSVHISDLSTTSVLLTEEYEYRTTSSGSSERVLTGYTAENKVVFTISNTSLIGDIIGLAMENGANRIDGVEFTASAAELGQAKLLAIRQATEEAAAYAALFEGLYSLSLGTPSRISVDSSNHWYQSPLAATDYYRTAMAQSIKVETPVEAGNIEVSASVSLSFNYSLNSMA